jgi:hypothetical protein
LRGGRYDARQQRRGDNAGLKRSAIEDHGAPALVMYSATNEAAVRSWRHVTIAIAAATMGNLHRLD